MADDRFLTRNEASEYIERRGLPCKATALSRYASTGGGPALHYFNRTPRYRTEDLDQWIAARLSGPHRRASEVASLKEAAA